MINPPATIACIPREVFSQTQQSLETLYQRTQERFDLVYVDGGSPPDIRSYLENASREYGFTLLRTDHYLTPNQARNLALRYVNSPYVVFVDNDVLVSRGWLGPLVDCAEQTGAWAVSPLYFEHLPEENRLHMAGGSCRILAEQDGRRYYKERHFHGHRLLEEIQEPIGPEETELIEFHTLLVSMEAFEKLGPLDEGLFCHAEHADLSLSIRAAGGRIFLEPKSKITYVPPRRLSEADRDFFELRWSEAWCRASLRQFIQKWELAPKHREVNNAIGWLRNHRRYGSRTITRLKPYLGSRVMGGVQKLTLNPLEVAWNRYRFPIRKFGVLQVPEPRVVNRPEIEPAKSS